MTTQQEWSDLHHPHKFLQNCICHPYILIQILYCGLPHCNDGGHKMVWSHFSYAYSACAKVCDGEIWI